MQMLSAMFDGNNATPSTSAANPSTAPSHIETETPDDSPGTVTPNTQPIAAEISARLPPAHSYSTAVSSTSSVLPQSHTAPSLVSANSSPHAQLQHSQQPMRQTSSPQLFTSLPNDNNNILNNADFLLNATLSPTLASQQHTMHRPNTISPFPTM